jgi:hypothetical protein
MRSAPHGHKAPLLATSLHLNTKHRPRLYPVDVEAAVGLHLKVGKQLGTPTGRARWCRLRLFSNKTFSLFLPLLAGKTRFFIHVGKKELLLLAVAERSPIAAAKSHPEESLQLQKGSGVDFSRHTFLWPAYMFTSPSCHKHGKSELETPL